jgi:phosphoenolpyruvate carboxykinase (GTP)
MEELLRVDVDGWLNETKLIREYYDGLGPRVPSELREELDALVKRLEAARG